MTGRRPVGLAVLAVLLVLAAGCVPGWNSTFRRPPVKPAAEVNTDPASMGRVTLVVWDQNVRGGENRQMTELNRQFEQRYPNIRIKRVERSFDDLRSTTKLGLTGSEPPDVLQVNNGKQDMGAFVRAGLLLPLDGYAQAYQWNQRYPVSVLRLSHYDDAGRNLGQGHIYGMPQTGELVGVYYNREKLAKLGLQPPDTWGQWDAALARAKRAGEVPVQFGNLKKTSGIHLFGFAQNRSVPPDEIYRLATGAEGASWQDKDNEIAASMLRGWAERGYLTPGFAGLDDDSAWRDFAGGQGVFHVSGSWLLGDLQAAMGRNVGFQLPPSHGGTSTVTGGTGLPFGVSAASRHPDAAAAYINFITSAHAAKVLQDTGNLPVVPPREPARTESLAADIRGAWKTASRSGGLVPYLDYATPTAYDTLTDAAQQLLAGDSAQNFLRRMQQDLEGAG